MPRFCIDDIFVNRHPDYFRIPVIAIADDRLLTFANRRLYTASDNAKESQLVYRRIPSTADDPDNIHSIFAVDGWNVPIGTVIVDFCNNCVRLFYHRWMVTDVMPDDARWEEGHFVAESRDRGKTWSDKKVKLFANTKGCYGHSHGAASGIITRSQAAKDRLVVPARFFTMPGESASNLQKNHYNCALFSDDHGQTWHTSEPVQVGTGEGCLAELSDGRIYYNSRAYFLDGKRRIAWSYDGGETFTDFSVDEVLTEPINGGCNAGMAIYPPDLSDGNDIILFSNPAGEQRERMTIRASFDGGLTWIAAKIIHEGPAAYSSMAVANDGTIYVLFENGDQHPYERISLASFTLEWLLN